MGIPEPAMSKGPGPFWRGALTPTTCGTPKPAEGNCTGIPIPMKLGGMGGGTKPACAASNAVCAGNMVGVTAACAPSADVTLLRLVPTAGTAPTVDTVPLVATDGKVFGGVSIACVWQTNQTY